MYKDFIRFVRILYGRAEGVIPLHAPTFHQRDKEYVLDAIDSTFVSSVGEYVNRFERELADFTGAVATVNGTTALQVALQLVGVQSGDEVITQPLTFVATANAIVHLGANPVFVDVDRDSMGLSPDALDAFMRENVQRNRCGVFNQKTGKRIAAIVPMHTFGHPCDIERLIDIARHWSIPLVEDAAEAIGSRFGEKHCGVFGDMGILSFNGNKTITCGGGGAILTNNSALADNAKHLTTTAKVPHLWEFEHNQVGYNFRMPNLNAALACAQLERLPRILQEKRELANAYEGYFKRTPWASFMKEPAGSHANYWLCTIALKDSAARDAFLEATNAAGIMTRPAWKLMTELPMYKNCQKGPLDNSVWLREHIVNLPSGVRN